MTDTRSAWGWGLASIHSSGQVLDTWFPDPQLGSSAGTAAPEQLTAAQTDDAELAAKFAPIAEALGEKEQRIVEELIAVQGEPVEIGGYYRPDPELVAGVMRPSETFNEIIASIA